MRMFYQTNLNDRSDGFVFVLSDVTLLNKMVSKKVLLWYINCINAFLRKEIFHMFSIYRFWAIISNRRRRTSGLSLWNSFLLTSVNGWRRITCDLFCF